MYYGQLQHFQFLIMALAFPYNCLWHWIRSSQCAGLMSISLQAIIRRWIRWLNPACIHLFSAVQNHHPPFSNSLKLFVQTCHCRHSKDRETTQKWFYWRHLTTELPFSKVSIVFCDADVILIYCIWRGNDCYWHWWMNGNTPRVLYCKLLNVKTGNTGPFRKQIKLNQFWAALILKFYLCTDVSELTV